MKKIVYSTLILLLIAFASLSLTNIFSADIDWSEYLGGPDRNHYSSLSQIDSANVNQLQVAWTYHTGDSGQIQCNPIIIKGILYGMTASTQPFAIDAKTGKEIWRVRKPGEYNLSTSRGVSYWSKGDDQRILYTNGPWLYAVSAATGEPINSFGDSGRTSLKAGLGASAKNKMVISNTPGTIFKNLIIMPLRVSEGSDASPGHIQAFDIQTGKLAWVFHTIPQPGEYGYETWPKNAYRNTDVGAANNWSGMSVDNERGILYVPTGSAAFDFYGGNRKGNNLFANCLLAIDASTGKRLWHYQLVHHDILDRDPPAPPNLITITKDGKKIDAVAQVTKQGYVFVFDRVTGKPLFPIKEKPVPASSIAGEKAWPTQPVPTMPAPFARSKFTVDDISPYATNKPELAKLVKMRKSQSPFTPLSSQGTIIFPGLDGGAEWGGAAADPTGIIYINSNEMAWRIALTSTVKQSQQKNLGEGQKVYLNYCAACHKANLQGNSASGFPSLVNIQNRKTKDYIFNVISHGKGMMPAFTTLSGKQKQDVIAFISGIQNQPKNSSSTKERVRSVAQIQPTYNISGYTKFLDSKGLPAVKPPWGTLNAINLNTGEYLWKIPFGTVAQLSDKGISNTGAENYGGPLITASGLLFIAATRDEMFRVYSKATGQLLWQTKLPAAGFATPSTYSVDGRQYVVIACGGTKLGAPSGDSYVAFALP